MNDHRTSLISDVLSQSDAAVMLVSAVLPLSLTERAFLDQEVLGRHVPRVMVVVSMLDQIPYDQRLPVFEAIRDRVESISSKILVVPSHPLDRGISSKILVVPSHPLDRGISEDIALEAIRLQLNELVAHANRRFWRDWQMAETLADYLARLARLGETALAAAHMRAEKREKELQQVRMKQQAIGSQWETIHLDLESRRLATDQELRRRISIATTPIYTVLSEQVMSARDPKLWWERVQF